MTCPICRGLRWVCVDHTTTPWGTEPWCCQCGAEGEACKCNPNADMPPETVVIVEAGDGSAPKVQ